MTIDHVLLTRFNLPTPGPESFVRAQEEWLHNRAELFLRHTVPTVRAQTVSDFHWIIYFDRESPPWLVERFAPLIAEGLFVPFYRQKVDWRDVVDDVHAVTGAHGDVLLTTNLDNDDAVSGDFVERLQAIAQRHVGTAIYLRTGLILQGDRLYLRHDPENAFCSVAESWDAPLTAWRDWHTHLRNHFAVISADGPPGWLQVVHSQNVSNRARGRIVDADRFRAGFRNQLDGLPRLSARAIAADRWVLSPVRESRERVRATGKSLLLRVWGKEGLDRLKSRIRRRQTTSSAAAAVTRDID